ncbi:MAG: two-component response regulator [Bacilli bacterium]|nr:two-component response regulator [Bacilli bacterium]
MNILLVEDDPKLGRLIQFKLNKEGFRVKWALNADEADMFIERDTFDIFLLDWMMPKKNGIAFCKELRAARNLTPILILTAKDAISDKVMGLNAGADDYLVKPFAFEELIARLQALHRRKETNWNGELLDLGETLQIRISTMEVVRSGSPVTLTRREFQLLVFMAEHPGQVLSREQLQNRVWGMDAEITLNAVDAAIKLLRKKVDDPFQDKMIQSVRGMGYRLTVKEISRV